MDSSKLSLKLFAVDGSHVPASAIVPVFHSWIQTHALADHLLIDVADYDHVQDGPGIMLISHEANFSVDHRGGKLGLTVQRKQPLDGSLAQKVATLNATLNTAAGLLSATIQFKPSPIEFRICDRLEGTNEPATFEAVKNDLLAVFPNAKLEFINRLRELFTVMIHLR